MAWDKTRCAEGILAPDLNDEIRANYEDLEAALTKEMNFSTGGTASLQGIMKQGSARCFSQAAAPATRVDGSAFASTDIGSLWIDSDDNKCYILTATTPVWTSIESVTIATLLAASRVFAEIITFSKAAIFSVSPTFTLGIVGNDSYLTGRNNAGDGNIDIAKVNTSDGVTLGAVTTLPDTSQLATSGAPVADAQLVNKKYVDDHVGHDGDGYVLRDVDGTPTKVYTKYLTGTLDADSSTSVAHSITGIDKILHVSAVCEDNGSAVYRVYDNQVGSTVNQGFQLSYNATHILIALVGSELQSFKYRIKIDYIL